MFWSLVIACVFLAVVKFPTFCQLKKRKPGRGGSTSSTDEAGCGNREIERWIKNDTPFMWYDKPLSVRVAKGEDTPPRTLENSSCRAYREHRIKKVFYQ